VSRDTDHLLKYLKRMLEQMLNFVNEEIEDATKTKNKGE
jgi:hypothetical protein